MKLKNSNFDKIQKLKLRQKQKTEIMRNSKTQIVTNSDYDKTQIVRRRKKTKNLNVT